MSNQLIAPKTTNNDVKLTEIETQRKVKELGWLGHFFGSPQVSPYNIAGFTVLLLLVCGAVYTLCVVIWWNNDIEKIKGFWGIIIPLLTLVMGYLFGKSTNQEKIE
jgi:NADH:ubiquinone oxidoreductase subunit 4 (subunit M)